MCVPSNMPCGREQSVVASTIKTLPHMYAINQTSVSYPTTLLADSGKISIVNMADIIQQGFGDWEYNYDGIWHGLSEVPAKIAVRLGHRSLIRYVPRPGFDRYGLRILNFFEDTQSDISVGDYMAIPSQVSIYLAMLLVHPVPVNSVFTIYPFEDEYEVMEDQKYGLGIPISRFVHFNLPVVWNPIPIPERYLNFVQQEDYHQFQESVLLYKMSRPVAKVLTDLTDFGRLKIVFHRDDGVYLLPISRYIPLDFKNTSLVFVPNHNVYGKFSIELGICRCLTGDEANMQNVTLPITVYPVNDSPMVPSQTILLPPIPFEAENKGLLVSDIVNGFAYDPENDEYLGVAIFSVPENKELGHWQFYDNNTDSWQDIIVENLLNPFKLLQSHAVGNSVDGMKAGEKDDEEFYGYRKKKRIEYYTREELQRQESGADEMEAHQLYQGLTLNVLLLENTRRIRFQLYGDVLWKRSDGFTRSFLGFTFWDGSDGLYQGRFIACITVNPTAK